MQQGEHPGFEYWDVTDRNHPFPVGAIDLGISIEGGGSASASFTLPPKLPKPKVVAQRSAGMAQSARCGSRCVARAAKTKRALGRAGKFPLGKAVAP